VRSIGQGATLRPFLAMHIGPHIMTEWSASGGGNAKISHYHLWLKPVRGGRWLIFFHNQDSKSQSANRLMAPLSNAEPSDPIPTLLALTRTF